MAQREKSGATVSEGKAPSSPLVGVAALSRFKVVDLGRLHGVVGAKMAARFTWARAQRLVTVQAHTRYYPQLTGVMSRYVTDSSCGFC